eukprot:14466711-Alexandrium_andersonii.AAC.1
MWRATCAVRGAACAACAPCVTRSVTRSVAQWRSVSVSDATWRAACRVRHVDRVACACGPLPAVRRRAACAACGVRRAALRVELLELSRAASPESGVLSLDLRGM